MKKTLMVILCIAMIACVLAGCHNSPKVETTTESMTEANGEWKDDAFKAYGLEKISSPDIINSFGINITDSGLDTEFIATKKDTEALAKNIFDKAFATGTVASVITPDTKVKKIDDVKRDFGDGSYQYIFEYTVNSKKYLANINCVPTLSDTEEINFDVIVIIDQIN